MQFYDIIGLVGVFIILSTYFLLQINKIDQTSYKFSLLNLFGGSFILYSLFFEWNLSAVIIEGSWIIISLIGLAITYKNRRKKNGL